MEMGAMGTMGMGIRRGLGELGRFLFVFRRRVPVVGILAGMLTVAVPMGA